jgi:hypothetical protein
MIESHVTGPATGAKTAAPQNFELARHRPRANKGSRRKSALRLDTRLSSSSVLANSTRHSVTSRIQRNSRFLNYLIFSTRHLNATLVKRTFVEKFNTSLRSDFALETRVRPCFFSIFEPSVHSHDPTPPPRPRKLSVDKNRAKASMMTPFARPVPAPGPAQARLSRASSFALAKEGGTTPCE